MISTLAELEARVQIEGMVEGGLVTRRRADSRAARLVEMVSEEPFIRREAPADLIRLARSQLATAYCRTLDRLHLAAMEGLDLRRILTNDDQQARAARALGLWGGHAAVTAGVEVKVKRPRVSTFTFHFSAPAGETPPTADRAFHVRAGCAGNFSGCRESDAAASADAAPRDRAAHLCAASRRP